MSVENTVNKRSDGLSAPWYFYSLRCKSLNYLNAPFPASSTAEAISRVRHSLNASPVDNIEDLELVFVGSFISTPSSDPKSGSFRKRGFVPAKEISTVCSDLTQLIDPKIWCRVDRKEGGESDA